MLARAQHGAGRPRCWRLARASILGLLLGRVNEQTAELLVVHGEDGVGLASRRGPRKATAKQQVASLGWGWGHVRGARGRRNVTARTSLGTFPSRRANDTRAKYGSQEKGIRFV